MKKVLLLLLLLGTLSLQGQNNIDYKDIEKLTFFGVDYTIVKVYGALEMNNEFRSAFYGINQLFQLEPKKYNVEKYFNKRNVVVMLEPVLNLIDNADWSELKVQSNDFVLSYEEVEEHVRNFPTGDATGYGALIIADFLDKGKKRGTYDVVVFDIDTKEIIRHKKATGKAGGFGLRNYWASTMLDALKQAPAN